MESSFINNSGVAGSLRYAGFLARLIAYIVDMIIIGIAEMILMIPGFMLYFFAIVMSTSDNPNVALLLIAIMILMLTVLIAIILMFVYFAWFESSKYMATPGKMLMKLRVTDMNGNRISFITALLRFILKTLLNQLLWIGSLAIIFSEKKQGLYDMLMSTVVVQD
jgi:uncharacterized RDD family membrane protein YckC